MKIKQLKNLLSVILCSVLIAAMSLFAVGCNSNSTSSEIQASEPTKSAAQSTNLGTGATKFTLNVVDDKGNETTFQISTDKKTVGDALTELGLISGDESKYGLYIKTVNGLTFDYETDKKYWAFYVDGEYATSGIDLTEIDPNVTYALKVE